MVDIASRSRRRIGAALSRQQRARPSKGRVGIEYITEAEGAKLLDRQARKYLGMSGDEFRRRYRAGTIEDPDRSDVIRVSMILPLAGE